MDNSDSAFLYRTLSDDKLRYFRQSPELDAPESDPIGDIILPRTGAASVARKALRANPRAKESPAELPNHLHT